MTVSTRIILIVLSIIESHSFGFIGESLNSCIDEQPPDVYYESLIATAMYITSHTNKP